MYRYENASPRRYLFLAILFFPARAEWRDAPRGAVRTGRGSVDGHADSDLAPSAPYRHRRRPHQLDGEAVNSSTRHAHTRTMDVPSAMPRWSRRDAQGGVSIGSRRGGVGKKGLGGDAPFGWTLRTDHADRPSAIRRPRAPKVFLKKNRSDPTAMERHEEHASPQGGHGLTWSRQ